MVQLVSNSCENRHSLAEGLWRTGFLPGLALGSPARGMYFPDGAVKLLWSVASQSQLHCKNVHSVSSAGLSPLSNNTLQWYPSVKDVQREKCMHDQPTGKIRKYFSSSYFCIKQVIGIAVITF